MFSHKVEFQQTGNNGLYDLKANENTLRHMLCRKLEFQRLGTPKWNNSYQHVQWKLERHSGGICSRISSPYKLVWS